MFALIRPDSHYRRDFGPFRLRRIRPGINLGDPLDLGFGGLGLIDHANLTSGLVVPRHEHRNDEIISYLRSGSMEHIDRETHEWVRPDRLMVMNSGSGFWHEERVPSGEVEMLQIFIRPWDDNLPPLIQFNELNNPFSVGQWRLLTAPEGTQPAPTFVRQSVYLFDLHLPAGTSLPCPTRPGFDTWFYVFAGAVRLGSELLGTHWAIATDDTLPDVSAITTSEVVLFLVDRSANHSRLGTLSS